jgi:hypothetical protein
MLGWEPWHSAQPLFSLPGSEADTLDPVEVNYDV